MATESGFHRWQTEHCLVLRSEIEPSSSLGDWIEAAVLLPLATFIVVAALARLIG